MKYLYMFCLTVLSLMYYKVYNFLLNCKRMIDWFPVIWNDRDWDHLFLYRLLGFKLHRVHHFLKYDGVAWHSHKALRRIKTAALLCDRLANESAYENAPEWKLKEIEVSWWNNKKMMIADHDWVESKIEADLELLNKIIKKHSRVWWD